MIRRTTFLIFLGYLTLLDGHVAYAEDRDSEAEAVAWLGRMGEALRERNYQGIFSYIRGSIFDTVRIVHRVSEDGETERLFNLNGDVRELYRHDDEILCFHPKAESDSAAGGDFAIEEHSVQIGPFTPAFSDKVLATRDLYNLSMLGEDRIAGRPAVTLSITPRFRDRYGYRLWLDQETGLLLQSHLVDRGRVKEIFQFTSLEIDEALAESELASAIEGETVSHALALDMNEMAEKPVWRVSWLPDGFRPVRIKGNRLHFSDGLATFSVFVEKPDAASLPEMTTTLGGTVVITHRIKQNGSQVTVVGEVPVQTARRVAESVEPVIY